MNRILDNSKGSALVAVLAVLFILLATFFSVFAFAVSRAAFLQKKINLDRASYLADAGINHLIYLLSKDSLNYKQAIENGVTNFISANEKYSVTVSLSGGYLMATSTGIVGTRKFIRKALIGLQPWRDLNAAVINGNLNYPLVLAGKSLIKGDAIAGPESVIRGSIEGEMNSKEDLVDGKIYAKRNLLFPKADPQIMGESIAALYAKSKNPSQFFPGSAVLSNLEIRKKDGNMVISIENNLEINSLILSSKTKEISIFAGGNIEINDKSHIQGPIEIVSNGYININDESRLDGALLVADDSILFQDRVNFRGQAISGKAIKVKGGRIDYPSLLYVWSMEESVGDSNYVEFMPGTFSRTMAFITEPKATDRHLRYMLKVDTGASITGLIYSQQYTELHGLFKGISLTDSYWFYKAPTAYVNWLKDVVIDRAGLDFMPVLPISFPNQNGFAVFREYEEK
ncbi:hypothetical protein TRIP_C60012 [Candidatus Zixiibacteriota bacterium]|nr:hypothetical protein TRIP_C60012 [candidate division Zixibacteria bacterium]